MSAGGSRTARAWQLMPLVDEMCGRGFMCHWRGDDGKPLEDCKAGDAKRNWHKCTRKAQRWGKKCRPGHHLPYGRRNRPGPRLSLRPVNNQGNRAPGMRAPRNTNQFLMHEKYQMMHMRSDSVGTDSGSDCEMDIADMDSYLGMLENARGGLMDGPDPFPAPARFCPRRLAKSQHFQLSLTEIHQEESMQYFPSEDDVMQSEDFMEKDFIDFCDRVTCVAPYAV
nr:uncharacterized protein LOC111837471 [Paramormyrops kingsleyae]